MPAEVSPLIWNWESCCCLRPVRLRLVKRLRQSGWVFTQSEISYNRSFYNPFRLYLCLCRHASRDKALPWFAIHSASVIHLGHCPAWKCWWTTFDKVCLTAKELYVAKDETVVICASLLKDELEVSLAETKRFSVRRSWIYVTATFSLCPTLKDEWILDRLGLVVDQQVQTHNACLEPQTLQWLGHWNYDVSVSNDQVCIQVGI